ncbi:SRPBCC domain-containing protein [Erysipelothrix inopinata]|uniref:SRPBCC domain-containing protein n=1 Tax=Erysipelothrix inopinata TaxID=225084 RepID=A0A7G9RWW3_9FIRM|nr:SRPBCC domain-containing protein [Erysipelothrix inopinata]QNN60088.1 SRPBCC domain-containing protein [Erysipelothrix inopinata]
MIKETIYIEKPINEVWDFVELQFAKAFKCSPSKILGKETTAETLNFTGKTMTVSQKITTVDKEKHLVMTSESGKDLVESHYEFEADEADNGTYLTFYESGEGKKSKLRSMNFSFFSLPILRRSTKKKFRRRLESLKVMIESDDEL